MRSLAALFVASLLVACQTGDLPAEVEPTPAADAVAGTASGGVVVNEPDVKPSHFGEAFTLETPAIKAVDLLADPANYASEEPILVEGTVLDVCQKAGCWMIMSDGENQIRVTVKEHGFSVDKDGTGAWARVQGKLVSIDVPQDTVDHFEGESNRPELVEKAGHNWQLIATGVEFTKNS